MTPSIMMIVIHHPRTLSSHVIAPPHPVAHPTLPTALPPAHTSITHPPLLPLHHILAPSLLFHTMIDLLRVPARIGSISLAPHHQPSHHISCNRGVRVPCNRIPHSRIQAQLHGHPLPSLHQRCYHEDAAEGAANIYRRIAYK